MNPLVSVIIPSHNEITRMLEIIRSVIANSTNVEVVIDDDGSPDFNGERDTEVFRGGTRGPARKTGAPRTAHEYIRSAHCCQMLLRHFPVERHIGEFEYVERLKMISLLCNRRYKKWFECMADTLVSVPLRA